MAGGSRLWRIDAFKGVAIVLVVFVHAYYPAPEMASAGERQISRTLYFAGHLAVPVFLALSGYLFALERRPAREVLGRKFMAILLPTFIWSVVALAVHEYRFGIEPRQAAIDLALLNTSGQYYYVFVLALLVAGGLALRGRAPRTLAVVALAGACVAVGRIAVLQGDEPGTSLERALLYRDPLIWAGFFALGYSLAVAGVTASGRLRGALLGVAAGCLAWWFATGAVEASYFRVPVITAGLAVALAAALSVAAGRDNPPGWAAPLTILGRHSFAVFLVHMPLFIGLVSDEVYGQTGAGAYWSRVGFRFAAGLAGSLVLAGFVRLVVPSGVARFLGFQGRPAGRRRPAVAVGRGRIGANELTRDSATS